MAQKEEGRIVEQCWVMEGEDRVLMLNVTVDGLGDPLWTLFESKITKVRPLWEHRTRDSALIHSLVLGESTGQVVEAAVAESEDSGLPSGMSLSLGYQEEGEEAEKAERKPLPRQSRASSLARDRDGEEAILQGDIKKVPLHNVLQSIQMGKMTGRLAVRSEGNGVDIYFDDGEPIHATDGLDTGDEVVMDLISLRSGKFKFITDERTVDRTVKRRLDGLLMEAIALVDQSTYLEEEGLNNQSYLIARNPSISDEQFLEIIARGAPVDQMQQLAFFRAIGEHKMLLDVLRQKPLKRSEWVPIAFNLVTLNLMSVSDKPPAESRSTDNLAAADINLSALDVVLAPLTRPETGVLTFPALQYFLGLECFRYQYCGMPITLVVFGLTRNLNDPSPPDSRTIRKVMDVVKSSKRPIDILGHFQGLDFALVLPNTGTRSAAVFVQKLRDKIEESCLNQGGEGEAVRAVFGIAGIPENCSSIGQLVAAAGHAKRSAKTLDTEMVMFKGEMTDTTS